mgnify:CR=1 FL=1
MNVVYEDCIIFLDRVVSIGVRHQIMPDRLFYYYGKLTDVTIDAVKIQMTHGIKIIPMREILEIKLHQGVQ